MPGESFNQVTPRPSGSRRGALDRRGFLTTAGATVAAAGIGGAAAPAIARRQAQPSAPPPPPAPAGITTSIIAEAEKLAGIQFNEAKREQMLQTLEREVQRLLRELSLFAKEQTK